jgi:CheY-specific phosphatase CheX
MIPAKESARPKPSFAQREQWLPVLEWATREVFQVMLGSELTAMPANRAAQPLEVTAMVGLAGGLCGVVTFRCGFVTATRLTSIMLAKEISDSDEQAGDAVGEVCNKRPDLL